MSGGDPGPPQNLQILRLLPKGPKEPPSPPSPHTFSRVCSSMSKSASFGDDIFSVRALFTPFTSLNIAARPDSSCTSARIAMSSWLAVDLSRNKRHLRTVPGKYVWGNGVTYPKTTSISSRVLPLVSGKKKRIKSPPRAHQTQKNI